MDYDTSQTPDNLNFQDIIFCYIQKKILGWNYKIDITRIGQY